jgi:hypothetical protein
MLKLSEYLAERFGEYDGDNIIKTLNPTENEIIKLSDITNIHKRMGWSTLANYGDMLSVIYGGYARYKTSIENGMTEEEAIKDLNYQTAATQQSNLATLRSNVVKKRGYLYILRNLFKSQEQQYQSKSAMNIIKMIKKETGANHLESIIIYNMLVPLVMTAVGGLINNIYGKEDKDISYYLKDLFANIGMSFFGLHYLFFIYKTFIGRYGRMSPKRLLLNVADMITGLPVESYGRLGENWLRD